MIISLRFPRIVIPWCGLGGLSVTIGCPLLGDLHNIDLLRLREVHNVYLASHHITSLNIRKHMSL